CARGDGYEAWFAYW
nr:immunoglobulin heavy chain junction region [Mus musculus]